MITFKQYLQEIFEGNSIYRWSIHNNDDPLICEFFTDKGEKIWVTIYKRNGSNKTTMYDISFGRMGGASMTDTMDLTGTNDTKSAIKVYNTVIDIIKTKLAPHVKSGDQISYEAYNARTIPVYTKFAKMIVKQTGGKLYHGNGTFRIMI